MPDLELRADHSVGTPRSLLDSDAPPSSLSPALQALWWAARGDWDKAHGLMQDESGADAAWVHAHLHRAEGDLANAGYWYRQAGRPLAQGDLAAEREKIAAALLTDA